MREHNIDRRASKADQEYATYTTHEQGYKIWKTWDSEKERNVQLFVHRLLGVAKYGIEPMKDMVVHHKNKHKYDNRMENIEIMTNSSHASHHNPKGIAVHEN